MKRSSVFLAFLGVAACDLGPSEPAPDPCSALLACEVAGVDVAVLGVVPRWSASQPFDEEVDAHVVAAGDDLVVDMFLLNRGTSDATDSILVYGYFNDFQHFVSAARRIHPLRVGEQLIVRLTFTVPDGVRWVVEPHSATRAEGVFAIDGDFGDVDPSNHAGQQVAYHPRVPILAVSAPELPDTMRTHQPYATTLTVTNHSPFVDFTGFAPLEFCMTHLGHGYCETGAVATHSAVTVGPVEADESEPLDVVFEFTGESLWYFDSPSLVFVNPCLPAGDDNPVCLHRAATESDYDVVAIPDLVQECVTSPLSPPDTLRATESFCLGDGADEGTAHTIGVFHGAAGDCLRVTPLGDAWSYAILDRSLAPVAHDDALGCHVLPHDGDYYLRAYSVATGDPAGGILALERID